MHLSNLYGSHKCIFRTIGYSSHYCTTNHVKKIEKKNQLNKSIC